MNLKKSLLFTSLIFYCIGGFAQNKYQLSIGTSIPDNISSKYLKSGIYLAYGIDFKVYNHFYINTDISISYNKKNASYRNGFDENPYIIANPDEKYYYEFVVSGMDTYFNESLYLFNSSIDLKLKYLLLNEKRISPYLLAGISVNYSILKDPILSFSINEKGDAYSLGFSKNWMEYQFNIGYQVGIGLNYNIENNKSIFIESQYKLQPNVKFGVNNNRVGLFIINAGISLPFK